MKVMPSIAKSVADNLFELGQGVVKGTANAAADIASETIEQVVNTPGSAVPAKDKGQTQDQIARQREERKALERRQFSEVKGELEQYMQRKRQLDQKIAQEKAEEKQQERQEGAVKKQKRESWVSKLINRSQTTTEKGKLVE